MRDLLTIVPSRGRPENARRLIEAFHATTAGVSDLAIVVNGTAGEISAYEGLAALRDNNVLIIPLNPIEHGGPDGMPAALNAAAGAVRYTYRYLGFMGDDHLPRTPRWDARYVAALEGMGGLGVVYGNDLVHGPMIPTQCAMSSSIPRKLGYMVPPGFRHLYVDNVWKLWGEGIQRIAYLPDTIIEHVHPIVGKAEIDAGYARVNAPDVVEHDLKAWDNYTLNVWPGLLGDQVKLTGLVSDVLE